MKIKLQLFRVVLFFISPYIVLSAGFGSHDVRAETLTPHGALPAGPAVCRGPENGWLVIAGGNVKGPEILARFITLAGGPAAPIVFIPTAAEGNQLTSAAKALDELRRAGASNLTLLHTNSRAEADSEAFAAPLRAARGVWIGGGRQWRLADSYLGTSTERELHALLERGGVIGGSSAGASIQASYLVRGAPEGNTIMMARGHERGFAFLENSAIDQHLLARGRLNDMLEVIRVHPELLGIGIDEDTAIVVHGGVFEVIGKSKVAVYNADPGALGDKPYLMMAAGERFDLQARKPASAAAGKSYFVDSAKGDDANDGSEARPWKSLRHVNNAMDALRPGDRVLFRRGAAWPPEVIKIHARGTEEAPITFGAYGPESEKRPALYVISLSESEHIVVRDLDLGGSKGGPGLAAEHSGYLTFINNAVHDTASNGIVLGALTHHTATIDNVIYNVAANDGVSIHDRNWGPKHEVVGGHHWVAGNIIYNMGREDCIDAASNNGLGSPDAKAAEDIKIIDNRCLHANAHGIVAGHDTTLVWVIGNTILDCGRNTANAMAFGNPAHASRVQITGNLLIDNMRRVQLDASGRFEHNTILTRNATRTSIVLGPLAAGMAVRHNLVATRFHEWLSADPALNARAFVSDWNWFSMIGADPAEGQLRRGSLYSIDDWRKALGQDAHSVVGAPPGFSPQPADQVETDATKWDEAFFRRFVPPADWEGFRMDGGCGAFGPDGRRQGMSIEPFEKYPENNGYGWHGPPEIRRRYPLGR